MGVGVDKPAPSSAPDPAGHKTYLSVAKGKPPDKVMDRQTSGTAPKSPDLVHSWAEIRHNVDGETVRRREALVKLHSFHERGGWHPPSHRHANGRGHTRTDKDSVGSVDQFEAVLPQQRRRRFLGWWEV